MVKKNTKTETLTIDRDSPTYVLVIVIMGNVVEGYFRHRGVFVGRGEAQVSMACRDQISKHRSCWKHVSAIFHAERKKMTKKDQQEIEKFEYTSPCFLNFPCRERSKRNIKCKKSDHVASKLSKKLDSKAFEDYMAKIWKSFSKDKKNAFTYFDCLWFHNYMKQPYRFKVLSWIKKKHILSKKYTFVPLVCWGHWSLLIFCNFGESLQSDSNPPCMLLLDSLEAADPRRVEPEIRKFVFDIYNAEGKLVTKKDVKKIPLWMPQVPQQRNSDECGSFVLYFVHLFLEGVPENFDTKSSPSFLGKSWFTSKGLDCFCKKLHSLEN